MISNQQLLELEYYIKRMTSYLSESNGFKERVKNLHSLLLAIDDVYNNLFKYYDIFMTLDKEKYENYYYDKYLANLDNVGNIEGAILDGNGNYFIPNLVLDKIGAIFNCKRSFMIRCCNLDANGNYLNNFPAAESDLESTKYVTLNNKDYLTYIKMTIKKSFFNGTREELAALYYGEDVKDVEDEIQLLYVTQYNIKDDAQGAPGQATIYWINAAFDLSKFSATLRYMFLNGMLTIESAGIKYTKAITNINNIGIFDQSNWDECIWG